MVQLPSVGFSFLSIIQAMIHKQGSLIAVCIGGMIAFYVIRSWLHYEKTDLDDEISGEWEDYLTPYEENLLYVKGCSYNTEMKIRARCYSRMKKNKG